MVIATEFIPHSQLSIVSTIVMWECTQWLGKNIMRLKKLQESMDRCTGCRDITEMLLKMALNTAQSIVLSDPFSNNKFSHIIVKQCRHIKFRACLGKD